LGQVGEQAEAAEEDRDAEGDPEDQRVNIEVAP
jgi:hypothetical protein